MYRIVEVERRMVPAVVRHKDSAGVECHTDSADRYILDSVPVGHSQAVLALHCRVVLVPDLDLDPKP